MDVEQDVLQPLMRRLAPHDLALKGRLAAVYFENPFLECGVDALAARLHANVTEVTAAAEDLCACGVLSGRAQRLVFTPEPAVYNGVAAWREALRGNETALRQQAVELETLARLRDKLAVSQEEVSAILEMVPAGVLLIDRYGHVLKHNGLAKSLLKLGKDALETDVCTHLGLDLGVALKREGYFEVEGTPPLAVTTQPFRVSRSDAGAVITVQDITARREMEAEAERMREAFFSMIRHELHKPLMTIDRYLGQLDGANTEDAGLGLARAAAAHLGAMIDDMLLLARLERDPMAVVCKDAVSLQFLLAGADLAFRARAQEAGLELVVHPPQVDVVFTGDARRLGQVVGNLLDNAIKFSPAGGRVVLAGGCREERVWVSVADSGPGIPEGERAEVFGKFYQADTDGGRQPGLGLGLAICRLVVAAHNGDIVIDDAEGGGARITVWLPVDPQEESP